MLELWLLIRMNKIKDLHPNIYLWQNVCINVAMESSSSIANYLWRGALRTPQYSHAQKCFFFSFHTQQRICCRAILPKILLTLEMPHYYHWFSVKNHNHLIHTMCGYIYIYNGILCISFVKVLSLLLGKSISQVNQSQSATTQQHQYVAAG